MVFFLFYLFLYHLKEVYGTIEDLLMGLFCHTCMYKRFGTKTGHFGHKASKPMRGISSLTSPVT